MRFIRNIRVQLMWCLCYLPPTIFAFALSFWFIFSILSSFNLPIPSKKASLIFSCLLTNMEHVRGKIRSMYFIQSFQMKYNCAFSLLYPSVSLHGLNLWYSSLPMCASDFWATCLYLKTTFAKAWMWVVGLAMII